MFKSYKYNKKKGYRHFRGSIDVADITVCLFVFLYSHIKHGTLKQK